MEEKMKIYFVKCGDMYLADLLEGEIGTVVLDVQRTEFIPEYS